MCAANSRRFEAAPTEATVWVAAAYPGWQRTVLEVLSREAKQNGGQLPDNKVISQLLAKEESLKKVRSSESSTDRSSSISLDREKKGKYLFFF